MKGDNLEEKVTDLGKPPSWIEGYVKWVLLDGESILPYICKEKEDGDEEHES